MDWTVATITFIATVTIIGALGYAFLPSDLGITGRLSRMLHGPVPVAPESRFKERQQERIRESLASVGKLVSPGTLSSKSQLLLARAGFRSPEVMQAINGVRLILPFVLAAIVYFSGAYRYSPVMILIGAGVAGYLLPEFWLSQRVRSRQHKLQLAIPDGLDLLVICVEAGLGLDQALQRVSEELHITHPEFSYELQLVTAEMRLGKTRMDALRDLGRRTGLEDIKALVAMLVQTERFGTSIAQSLRVHSDDLRMKRRQRAEEAAAKISVKMVPVLVLFIFPAMMIVTMGPAVITIMRVFMKMR